MAKKLLMKDLMGKSFKDLVSLRNTLKKEVYELKLKNSIRALNQTHLITLARRNVARVNTAISKKNAA